MNKKRWIFGIFLVILLMIIFISIIFAIDDQDAPSDGFDAFQLPSSEIAPPKIPSPTKDSASGISQQGSSSSLDTLDVSKSQADSIVEGLDTEIGLSELTFTFKDYNTKDSIADIHISLSISDINTGKQYTTLRYVDPSGKLKLSLAGSSYLIQFKVDDISTLGKDYLFQQDIFISEDKNLTIFLYPVGSIRGTVYDEKDNAVKDANIKFSCSSTFGETSTLETDSFGSFSALWLPAGDCKVYAESDDKVGSLSVTLSKGSMEDVEIRLSTGITSSKADYTLFFIITLILILIIFTLMLMSLSSRHSSKTKVPIPNFAHDDGSAISSSSSFPTSPPQSSSINISNHQNPRSLYSQRTIDIMNTLNDKEKYIVDYLLKNNNTSTQSNLRYSLGIPKTTLVRIFQNLEVKKIIHLEKVGKFCKITLTDWFLGK